MQVISSSPPSPAVASFRVSTQGGQVVSGCRGTSGQVCAPPGGCSPGFNCRVGWVFFWLLSCSRNDRKFAENFVSLSTNNISLLVISLSFSFSSGAGKTQVERASKATEGEPPTLIPLSSHFKCTVKFICYSEYYWGQPSTWIHFWPFSPSMAADELNTLWGLHAIEGYVFKRAPDGANKVFDESNQCFSIILLIITQYSIFVPFSLPLGW